MEKVGKVFSQGDYSVIVSKDGAKSMVVQLVKTTMARFKEADGKENTRQVHQALETYYVAFEDKRGEVRLYDELDKELETKISEVSRKAKSMATKEALGTNLLNKVIRKYESEK